MYDKHREDRIFQKENLATLSDSVKKASLPKSGKEAFTCYRGGGCHIF